MPQLLNQLRGLQIYILTQFGGGTVTGQFGDRCPQFHHVFRSFIRGLIGRGADLQGLELLQPVQALFRFFEAIIQRICRTQLKSSTTGIGRASRLPKVLLAI